MKTILATIPALAAAALCLASCTTKTAPDGTTVKSVDKEAAAPWVSILAELLRAQISRDTPASIAPTK